MRLLPPLFLALAAAGPASAAGFEASYSGYFLGLKLGEIELSAEFGEDDYAAEAFYSTKGLLSWVNDDVIEARVSGAARAGRLSPRRYRHDHQMKKKRVIVEMEFTGDDIVTEFEPPEDSMGDPPATQEQRAEAVDVVSGLMQLSLNIGDNPDQPCGYQVAVFDGKQRYDLRPIYSEWRKASLDAWRGRVLECDVYYIPVAGFDEDDIPKEKHLNTPLKIWFAETGGGYAPVRLSYPVGIGALVIEAKTMTATPGESEHAAR